MVRSHSTHERITEHVRSSRSSVDVAFNEGSNGMQLTVWKSVFFVDALVQRPNGIYNLVTLGWLKYCGCWVLLQLPLDDRTLVLYDHRNKFALRGGPEFHAEWLRDEP
jgi:hypothetical protein